METNKLNGKNKNTNFSLSYQLSYFKWYLRIPAIIAFTIIIFFFVWGIVDRFVFDFSSGRDAGPYGVMRLNTPFGCWLVWFVIGLAVALIAYVLLKIILSQKILTIFYLQKLCGEYNSSDQEDDSNNEETSKDNSDVSKTDNQNFDNTSSNQNI